MTVQFGTSDFEKGLQHISSLLNEGKAPLVAFIGADVSRKRDALDALVHYTNFLVHQIEMNKLIGDQKMQTEGNLREQFDTAHEPAVVLYFEQAEALFDLPEERDAAIDALSATDYLVERANAFKGITVLSVRDDRSLSRLADQIDLAVRFGDVVAQDDPV